MNLAVLYVSLQHNTAPKFVRARQAFLALGHALLPIVRDAEEGLRNPKPVVETTPLTFPHTVLENDFNSSSQLATHPAVLAVRCRDLVASLYMLFKSQRFTLIGLGSDLTVTSSPLCSTTSSALPSTVVTHEPFASTCRSSHRALSSHASTETKILLEI